MKNVLITTRKELYKHLDSGRYYGVWTKVFEAAGINIFKYVYFVVDSDVLIRYEDRVDWAKEEDIPDEVKTLAGLME